MIPDFKTYIGESVWADIHRRSNGTQERKEDDLSYINDMTVDDFIQFLMNEYPSTPEGKNTFISEWDKSNVIGFPIIIKDGSPISIFLYNCKKGKKWIGINSSFERDYPDIVSIIKKKYKILWESRISIKIYKDDPYENITYQDFIKLIDYLLNNITHHTFARKKRKKRVDESVWADIHRRSNGFQDRKEDNVNNLNLKEFYEYLLEHYDAFFTSGLFAFSRTEDSIEIPIIEDDDGRFYSIIIWESHKREPCITLSINFSEFHPDLFSELKQNFSINVDRDDMFYEIYPKGIVKKTEVNNSFFLSVIDFMIENGNDKESTVLVTKK